MKPQTTFTTKGALLAAALSVFVIGNNASAQGQRSAEELLDILGLSEKSINANAAPNGVSNLDLAQFSVDKKDDAAGDAAAGDGDAAAGDAAAGDAAAGDAAAQGAAGSDAFNNMVKAASQLTAHMRHGPAINLRDALRTTLYNQPLIQLAAEDVASAEAAARLAAAAFDINGFAEFGKREAYRPQTDSAIAQQRAQKQTLNILADSLGRVADGLEAGDSEVTISYHDPSKKGKLVRETISLTPDDLANNFGGLTIGGQQLPNPGTISLLQQLGIVPEDLTSGAADPAALQAQLLQAQADAYRLGQETTQAEADKLKTKYTERSATMNYTLGATKLFRNGIEFFPMMEFDQSSGGANTATTSLEFAVPLLKDRGARVENAFEESALIDWEASRMQYYHTYTEALLTTVAAFWECVAAQQTVQLLANSENINETFVTLTSLQVEEGEKTAGDLSQAISNFAASRATRIASEFGLLESRRNLALAMGLSGTKLLQAPFAAGDLPEPVNPDEIDSIAMDSVIQLATANRQDLAAQNALVESRKTLSDAFRENMGPSLDVNFGVNGVSRNTGNASEDYFGTWTDKAVGLGAFGTVRLDWPVQDSFAQSQYMSAAADQRRIATQAFNLERDIQTQSILSLEQIRNSKFQLDAFLEALEHSRTALIAEQARLNEGEGTLLDIIQVQNGFTSIGRSAIVAHQAHATALAKFRFDTGTMISGGSGIPGDESAVDIQDLTTLPGSDYFAEFSGLGALTVSGIPAGLLKQMKKAGYTVGLGGAQNSAPKPLFMRGKEDRGGLPLFKRNPLQPKDSQAEDPFDAEMVVDEASYGDEVIVLPNVDLPEEGVDHGAPVADVQPAGDPVTEAAPANTGKPKPLLKRLFGR